ncbi:MAG TPA: nucleotidyltransferase family protein [Propionibacterium sp.]|nr:nucleotidyltransferase family protein [Propionibacterium sp.]
METYEHMPLIAGVPLAAATLQVIADDAGVDLLHIKGASVDPILLQQSEVVDPATGEVRTKAVPRSSVDADVLVRPSHVKRFFAALRAHRWKMVYRFEDGSAFEHASTWIRPGLCHADIHRSFPGIGRRAEDAFDVLWRDRHTITMAGQECLVPHVAAQRLVLILHAVRGGDLGSPDIQRAWAAASEAQRAEVDALATILGADVALAAATGRLEEHRSARDYLLWKTLSTGNRSRTTMWLARVKAQPNPLRAVRTAFHLIAPKEGRLERDLGHRPGPLEVARAWGGQFGLVARELGGLVRGVVKR